MNCDTVPHFSRHIIVVYRSRTKTSLSLPFNYFENEGHNTGQWIPEA